MTTGKRQTDVDQDQDQPAQGQDIPSERALAEYNAEVLDSQPGLREAFLAMLVDVPEPDDDAAVKIVRTILGAESLEELNEPWETDGMRERIGRTLIVNAITRRPSDFTDGLGVYLGCECTDPDTGDALFITCGSVSSVAQLVRAHTLRLFPVRLIPVRAKRPTKRGYWPYHLQMLGRGFIQ